MRKSGIFPTVAVAIGCVLATTSCSKTSGPQEARRLLFRDLSEQLSAAHSDRPLDTSRVVITPDTSAVLPGVVYYWGGMPNPRIYDSFLGNLVAVLDGKATILSTFADWRHLASRSGWNPSDRADVLRVCQEALTTVGPRADPTNRPLIYEDTSSISGLLPPSVVDSILHLNLPRTAVRGDSAGGWVAEFWALELGQLTRYRCDLRPWERLTVTTRDSVTYVGYLNVLGPFPRRPRRSGRDRERR